MSDIFDRLDQLCCGDISDVHRIAREAQGEIHMARRHQTQIARRLIDAEAFWQEVSGLFGAGRHEPPGGAYKMLPADELLRRIKELLKETNPEETER